METIEITDSSDSESEISEVVALPTFPGPNQPSTSWEQPPRIPIKIPTPANRKSSSSDHGSQIPKLSLKRKADNVWEQSKPKQTTKLLDIRSEIIDLDAMPQSKVGEKEQFRSNFTCGNCHLVVPGQLWDQHLIGHYGLAWRVGIDEPIDLQNQTEVIATMCLYKNSYRLSSFKCFKCPIRKTTAKQILMHMEYCGFTNVELEDRKQKCSRCDKRMLPYTFQSHVETNCGNLAFIDPLVSSLEQVKPGSYTCGHCLKIVPVTDWTKHFNKHNGLAWRLNTSDISMDLFNRKSAINIVSIFKIMNNLKILRCEYCDALRKDPSDYVEHVVSCKQSMPFEPIKLCNRPKPDKVYQNKTSVKKQKKSEVFLTKDENECSKLQKTKNIRNNESFKIIEVSAIINNDLGPTVTENEQNFTIKTEIDESSDELLSSSKTPNAASYTCGNCKLKFNSNEWSQHLLFHNGLAWKEETDSPIDMTDRKEVTFVLRTFMKNYKIETVYCDRCNAVKKSPESYFNHIVKCGLKQQRIKVMKPKETTILEPFQKLEVDNIELTMETTMKIETDEDFVIKTEIEECNYELSSSNVPEGNCQMINNVSFTCGRCKLGFNSYEWNDHFLVHNSLAWREGVDLPIDLNDRKEIISLLQKFMKKHKLETITCERCNVKRKSPAGYFDHMVKCCLDPSQRQQVIDEEKLEDLINCCSENGIAPLEEDVVDILKWTEETVNLAIHIVDAKVTTEMVKTWRQKIRVKENVCCKYAPHCPFVGSTILEMTNHLQMCVVHKNNLYSCKLCSFRNQNYPGIYLHIINKHPPINLSGLVTWLAEASPVNEVEICPQIVSKSCKMVTCGNCNQTLDDRDWLIHLSHHNGLAWRLDIDAALNLIDLETVTQTLKQFMKDNCTSLVTCEKCSAVKKTLKGMVAHILKGCSEKGPSSPLSSAPKTARTIISESYELELQKKVLGPVARKMISDSLSFQKSIASWTLDFRLNHFSNSPLFPELKFDDNSLRVLQIVQATSYQSMLEQKSLRFARTLHAEYNLYSSSFGVIDWQRLELMEACVDDGTATLFCGGPVTAIAWTTFPSQYNGPEVLAVCCKSNPNEYYRLLELGKGVKCLIQLWSFEDLKKSSKPKLKYAIICDNGPIYELKFCPSGGYDNITNRLGLLAISMSSGIDIYALPLNLDSKLKIIDLQPVQILRLDSSDMMNAATCLDWTKAFGHSLVTAGFSNGIVAVWDLDSRSQLLRFEKNGLQGLCPVNCMQASQSAVTSVKFHPSADKSYLLVTSLDRRMKVFDLHSNFTSIEITSSFAKSRILATDWSSNWSAFIVGLDESILMECGGLFLKQPHDIGERNELLLNSDSSIYDMHCNDWNNCWLSVTETGDICGLPSIQMLTNANGKNLWLNRMVFGYTDVVWLNNEKVADHWNENYNYNDDNGIVFCDLDLTDNHSFAGLKVKNLRTKSIVGYPFSRINRVRFNENQQSFQYYAVGYQTGFVRVKHLKPE